MGYNKYRIYKGLNSSDLEFEQMSKNWWNGKKLLTFNIKNCQQKFKSWSGNLYKLFFNKNTSSKALVCPKQILFW